MAEEAQVNLVRWLESEKAGHDVGKRRAVWVWVTGGRLKWLRQWEETHPARD